MGAADIAQFVGVDSGMRLWSIHPRYLVGEVRTRCRAPVGDRLTGKRQLQHRVSVHPSRVRPPSRSRPRAPTDVGWASLRVAGESLNRDSVAGTTLHHLPLVLAFVSVVVGTAGETLRDALLVL
jgi:hypothetical protein